MYKKFLYLTKTSLNKKIKSKWFIIINILLCLLIVTLVNIDSIISFFGGDFNEKANIIVLDKTDFDTYQLFKNSILEDTKDANTEFNIKKSTKSYDELTKKIGDKIIVVLNQNDNDYLDSSIVSLSKIDSFKYQYISNALTKTKYNYSLMKSNIDRKELMKISKPINIKRVILEDDKKSGDEAIETVMGTVFPTLILPIFMLIVFLVQMIGAEIYEEKSTRGMEIIISNVSSETHFASKVTSCNLFAIIQGILLLFDGLLAFIVRKNLGNSSAATAITKEISDVWDSLVSSGFTEKLVYIIPICIILFILSFIAYSIVAGILASLTVNMEDYQQIQTPIMLILMAAYYLAIMSSMFHGSILIKVLSYVPFISCLLSPSLLILGEITVVDSIISILILIVFNLIVLKRGMPIYKEGILNYSSEKVFKKLGRVIKSTS